MEIVKLNRIRPFITKDGSQIREILSPRNSSIEKQSLAEARVAPGQTTEEHYHVHAEEIYYILQGRGRMWLEGKPGKVEPGDGIVIAPGGRHRIENIGEEPLVILCCCTPPYAHEDTILV